MAMIICILGAGEVSSVVNSVLVVRCKCKEHINLLKMLLPARSTLSVMLK